MSTARSKFIKLLYRCIIQTLCLVAKLIVLCNYEFSRDTIKFVFQHNCYYKKINIGQNITLSQLLCVNAIPFDGISESDLSNSLNIEFSTLSRNLDKLLDKGPVKKKSHLMI